MKEPVLLIMAAGMGSRFGGLKQIEPISDAGEIIMDFSLYDAMLAGFKKVVFVIKEEMEEDFRALIDDRAGKHLETEYVFQKVNDLPEGYETPEGRTKPWGTAHAVMAARNVIDGPFAVINADDYYGPQAFQTIYEYLSTAEDDDKYRYCMVGFALSQTITENGYVSRGVCELDKDGFLTGITERTMIMPKDGAICFSEDKGETWTPLPDDAVVSMNFWGFTRSLMDEMVANFPAFLDKALVSDPMKAEYFLPSIPDKLIKEEKATIKVLSSGDKWYGVTYKEDRDDVVAALQSMKDKGLYPDKLWK